MYIIHILDEIAISINQPGFWARFLRHIRILFGEKSKLSRFPIFSVVTHSSPILQLPNLDPDPNVCNCWMSSSCFEYIFGMGKETKSRLPLVPFTDKLLNFTRGCRTWRFMAHWAQSRVAEELTNAAMAEALHRALCQMPHFS